MINGQLIKKSRSSGAFGASAGIVFFIFDLISSDFSERILGDACQILVLLMIIVISVLFNLLAVTIILMKYSIVISQGPLLPRISKVKVG